MRHPGRQLPSLVSGLVSGAGLLVLGAVLQAPVPPRPGPLDAAADPSRIAAAYARLPLGFERNLGQFDARVRYASCDADRCLFLSADEAVLSLGAAVALRLRLQGAGPAAAIEGLDPLPGRSHYLRGADPRRWRTDVPQYRKVRYRGVYPGVDLLFHGTQGALEYDLLVAAGADPGAIRLSITGTGPVHDEGGDLVLKTPAGELRQHRPVVYQVIGGVRREIPGSYARRGADLFAFQLSSWDRGRPLVIDPVLSYSTYLGGGMGDAGDSIAVDAAGNAYMTRRTASTNFPATAGAFQRAAPGGGDAYVVKLNAAGTALIYSTYLGGSGDERGSGIAVDAAGSVYITGTTTSTDFPVTRGALQPGARGDGDAFVAKLNAAGSALIYSTYLGGSGSDGGGDIAIDAAGAAYITDVTKSADFPTTRGAFQAAGRGGDAFVAKLDMNRASSALVYSTYLGGGSTDHGNSIAVDAHGNAYVTGDTSSLDFPTTRGAFRTGAPGGGSDGFVSKLNAAGTALIYSTYLGGSSIDFGRHIALDARGAACVAGTTRSGDFPTSAGAPQKALAGGTDAYVARLNPAGSALLFSTYLGGSQHDRADGLALDPAGNAYVAGTTSSPDFPVTADALQKALRGDKDAFVAKVDTNRRGAALLFSTYLGGDGGDTGSGIAVDRSGNVYVTGSTSSGNFPTTPQAFQPVPGSRADAFMARIEDRPGTMRR